MTVQFQTANYGKISCDSVKKLAYFHQDDFESPIGDDGWFTHVYTRKRFHVLWPASWPGAKMCILEVEVIQTISHQDIN